MATEITKKNDIIYVCDFCHFSTRKKTDFTRHNSTQKHKSNVTATTCNDKNENGQKYLCEFCEKSYNDRTGLWRHNKICNISSTSTNTEGENIVISNNPTDKELIIMLIKQNIELVKETSELKTMMIEQQNLVLEMAKNGTTNITHTNSHNKAFNLNFFLNETCKDAMNIMDFVESIKLQVSDLESVGELGYVEGISNIIVKNLNALDVTQRPVHCTDKKRETIYIKDDNKWEKDEERKMMHKMIKKVADKNARLLPKFTEKYPDYKNYHSKNSDKYSKIIVESMGGSGDNDYEKEEKIIKNIAKNIVVEK